MTHKKFSLIFFVTLSCICMALLPVIIYSILSLFIFSKGLDAITRGNLIQYTKEYAELKKGFENGANSIYNRERKIHISQDYDNLPAVLRNSLPPEIKNNVLYKVVIKSCSKAPSLYFLAASVIDGETFYAFQNISGQEAEHLIKPQADETIYILLLTGGIILVILLFISRVLIKNISRPIARLSHWAYGLSTKNIDDPLPNFVYPELFNIASLIQKNVSREYEQVKREQIFSRYCSHELRTPISVISVGIELLQKKVDRNLFDAEDYEKILKRLSRSVYSMSYMIEAVLWIGNSKKELERQEVRLDNIIQDTVDDLQKIYDIDDNKINLTTNYHVMNLVPMAARIVLENIIRNGIQHADGNEIAILQQNNVVKTINKISAPDKSSPGFGLGLELIERLATRFGWEIKILNNNIHNIVIVRFK